MRVADQRSTGAVIGADGRQGEATKRAWLDPQSLLQLLSDMSARASFSKRKGSYSLASRPSLPFRLSANPCREPHRAASHPRWPATPLDCSSLHADAALNLNNTQLRSTAASHAGRLATATHTETRFVRRSAESEPVIIPRCDRTKRCIRAMPR